MFLRRTTHFNTAAPADAPPAGGGAPANGASPAGAPTTPAAPAVPPADASTISMPSDAFKQRLADEAAKANRKFLKEHGFDSPEAFKQRLDAAKTLEDSQKTEHEKAQARIKELEPQAARASTLAKLFESQVASDFATLPEAVQKAIDGVADGDAEKRHAQISMLRASGLLTSNAAALAPAGAPAPPAPPSPRTTAPAGGPPPAPGGAPKTKYEEYQAIAASPILGPLFYQNNAAEIERTRPPGT